jgi:hypothetical protein
MAVIVTFSVVGYDVATYKRNSASLGTTALLKQQPGFIMQAVYKTSEGLGAVEIWHSREQFEEWDSGFRPQVDEKLDADSLQMTHEITDLVRLVIPENVQPITT